ncbi:MAG: hypothetical protein V1777_02860 [Candidatus Micrarchaeota archaeon]
MTLKPIETGQKWILAIVILALVLLAVGWFGFDQYSKNQALQAEAELQNMYRQGVVDGQNLALQAVQERILSSLQQNGYLDVSFTDDQNQTRSERLWSQSVIQNQLNDQRADANSKS